MEPLHPATPCRSASVAQALATLDATLATTLAQQAASDAIALVSSTPKRSRTEIPGGSPFGPVTDIIRKKAKAVVDKGELVVKGIAPKKTKEQVLRRTTKNEKLLGEILKIGQDSRYKDFHDYIHTTISKVRVRRLTGSDDNPATARDAVVLVKILSPKEKWVFRIGGSTNKIVKKGDLLAYMCHIHPDGHDLRKYCSGKRPQDVTKRLGRGLRMWKDIGTEAPKNSLIVPSQIAACNKRAYCRRFFSGLEVNSVALASLCIPPVAFKDESVPAATANPPPTSAPAFPASPRTPTSSRAPKPRIERPPTSQCVTSDTRVLIMEAENPDGDCFFECLIIVPLFWDNQNATIVLSIDGSAIVGFVNYDITVPDMTGSGPTDDIHKRKIIRHTGDITSLLNIRVDFPKECGPGARLTWWRTPDGIACRIRLTSQTVEYEPLKVCAYASCIFILLLSLVVSCLLFFVYCFLFLSCFLLLVSYLLLALYPTTTTTTTRSLVKLVDLMQHPKVMELGHAAARILAYTHTHTHTHTQSC